MGNKMSIRQANRIGLFAASVASAATFFWSSASKARSIHLLSWGTCFGASVWVSFFSGIIAFKTLPRHKFGLLQSKTFPVYHAVQTGTLALTIAASAAENTPASLVDSFTHPNLYLLFPALFACVHNLFLFEPWTTSVMWERHKIERELGTGHEIGQLRPSDPEKANDPRLVAISKKFGMLHSVSVSLNLVALISIGCHAVYYLWSGYEKVLWSDTESNIVVSTSSYTHLLARLLLIMSSLHLQLSLFRSEDSNGGKIQQVMAYYNLRITQQENGWFTIIVTSTRGSTPSDLLFSLVGCPCPSCEQLLPFQTNLNNLSKINALLSCHYVN